MKVWKVGAALGNWNDRRNGGHDRAVDASLRWRVIDRVADWLFTRGET